MHRQTQFFAVPRRRFLPIAAVSFLLLCTPFFGYTKYLARSLAWVTIDLVDSPEAWSQVNDKGLIKSAAYFDEETERLASSLNLYMKPVRTTQWKSCSKTNKDADSLKW